MTEQVHKNALDLLQAKKLFDRDIAQAQAWATLALVNKLHEVVEVLYKLNATVGQGMER